MADLFVLAVFRPVVSHRARLRSAAGSLSLTLAGGAVLLSDGVYY